jgi:hypothetical protein
MLKFLSFVPGIICLYVGSEMAYEGMSGWGYFLFAGLALSAWAMEKVK